MSPELLKKIKADFQNVLSIMDSSEWLLFIATFIRRKNPITKIYWLYLLVGLIGGIYIFLNYDVLSIESRLWIVGLTGGLLLSLLVSPVLHELFQCIGFQVFRSKKYKIQLELGSFSF